MLFLSDRWAIKPPGDSVISKIHRSVLFYFIFSIVTLIDVIFRLMKKMPSGRAFVCMDLKNIPRILQQIFAASVLSTTRSS